MSAPYDVLTPAEWRRRRAAHEARVDAWTAGHRDRARRGEAHPVEDFLFTYYSQRPARLRRWSPGPGVVLTGAGELLGTPGWVEHAHGVVLSREVPESRLVTARWVRDLCARTAARPASYGCFGMHEWAMTYRQTPEQVRHRGWPLRLGEAGTAAVVDAGPVRCSHADAFRFFTAPARPLNAVRPTRETQADLEQPGCLHANMDLYKWAYKLAPWVPAELVADCFALAREIRALDMRASPYDLSALGYSPVPVETARGRAEYVAAQRSFALRAAPLRERVAVAAAALLAWAGAGPD
jgi:hypothetical protein